MSAQFPKVSFGAGPTASGLPTCRRIGFPSICEPCASVAPSFVPAEDVVKVYGSIAWSRHAEAPRKFSRIPKSLMLLGGICQGFLLHRTVSLVECDSSTGIGRAGHTAVAWFTVEYGAPRSSSCGEACNRQLNAFIGAKKHRSAISCASCRCAASSEAAFRGSLRAAYDRRLLFALRFMRFYTVTGKHKDLSWVWMHTIMLPTTVVAIGYGSALECQVESAGDR